MATAGTIHTAKATAENDRAGDVPAAALTCHRCGHIWTPRAKTTPKQCPACNSPNWNDPAATCMCNNCGHIWTARAKHPPKQCPACNSKRWARGLMGYAMHDKPLPTFRAEHQRHADSIKRDRREAKRQRRA